MNDHSRFQELEKYGINLGLSRVERLLSALGRPEKYLRFIHIAGTNGKGSTAAILSSILAAAGSRVGLYSSPHLQHYNERFRINGEEISDDWLEQGITAITPAIADLNAAGSPPTEFEASTVLAFWLFARLDLDWVVLETGLGGELDATNVVQPEMVIITSISLDHTDQLGPDLCSVAQAKAGIVKTGVPVITAAEGTALKVVAAAARRRGAPLCRVEGARCEPQPPAAELIRWQRRGPLLWGGETFALADPNGDWVDYRVALTGRHQVENAALAVAAASRLLVDRSPEARLAQIRQGLAAVVWPGRMELVRRQPPVVLDGAHNPSGAACLIRTLREFWPEQRLIVVLGVLADKAWAEVGRIIAGAAATVLVTPPPNPRAGDQQQLLEICRQYCDDSRLISDPTAAIQLGLALTAAAPTPSLLCITGSLYLVGWARSRLLD